MPTMAILDDRKDQRTMLMRSIRMALPKGWDCIECPLLADKSGYSKWLANHKVDVLVADQVLNEQAPDSTGTADYKGDEVTRVIRRSIPNFPIFIVTAFPTDHDLLQHLSDVEGVVTRRELTKNTKQYVPRMVRAGQRFNSEVAGRLEQLSKVAAKVASGRGTAADRKRLEELQVACGMSSVTTVDASRESMLGKVEGELRELAKLRAKIEKTLNSRKKQ